MRTQIERGVFFALLTAVTVGFGILLWPFFTPILWALVFSILFYPLSHSLAKKLGGRSTLASVITLLCVLVLVIVALFGVGALVANEAIDAYSHFSSNDALRQIDAFERNPLIEKTMSFLKIDRTNLEIRVVEIGKTISASIATSLLAIGSNAASFALRLLIMLYLIFVFLGSGDGMMASIRRALPLDDAKTRFLVDKFSRTVHALFRGTLIVALVQGLIGGILFAIAGVQSPVLWGVLMALFAMVPAVGPAIVWLPAGLILILSGDMTGGLIILIGGALIVGLIDNMLRPILIGRDLEMSDALVMLSILGGLIAFGPSGLIIGPVVSALFLASWSLFEREYKN